MCIRDRFGQLGTQFGQLPNFRLPPDPQQWWHTLMHGPGSTAPGVTPQGAPAEFAALGLTRERQEAWQRFTRLLAPVSYTHLDVYKRQADHRPSA